MGEELHWIASDIVPHQSLWAVLLTMSHQAGPLPMLLQGTGTL